MSEINELSKTTHKPREKNRQVHGHKSDLVTFISCNKASVKRNQLEKLFKTLNVKVHDV